MITSIVVPDTYELKLALGIELVQGIDKNKWALGDLGLSFVVDKRESLTVNTSLYTFGEAINIGGRRMQEYTQVARYYAPEHRGEYPNLAWTHYKYAMQAYKEDVECALEALEYAADLDLKTAPFKAWLDEQRKSRADALKSGLGEAIEIIRGLNPQHPHIEVLERILHGVQT